MKSRLYLLLFLRLAGRPDFQPWHWAWPGQHQPLHSIMTLITDLEDSPVHPLAFSTRQLVDLALTMRRGNEEHGITACENDVPRARPLLNNGSELWRYIRCLRDQVWENAGLDANIWTCPPSAEDIHFEGLEVDSLWPPNFDATSAGPVINPTMSNESWSAMGSFTDPIRRSSLV